MDLSVHIKDLLYKYNCVIIPGFGAFVMNYAHSDINPLTNTFTPPSKDIIFNPSIKRNDGLLADYISTKINATYEEAVLILSDTVEDLKITLNKGKKIYFKGIGTFSINREGSFQFESEGSVNFYLDSFGLSPLHSPAINREGIARRIEKKIKEKDIEHRERRIITTTGWAAAASILLFVILTWTVMTTDVIKHVNQNYAGILNTLVFRIYNNDLNKQPDIKDSKVESFVKADSSKLVEKEDQPEVAASQEPDPTSQPETLNLKHETYYIIGGCFSIEENAKKYMEELKSKGFNPQIIGKTKTGLIRVSYGSYDNSEKANDELTSIHSSQNPGAWLLHLTNN